MLLLGGHMSSATTHTLAAQNVTAQMHSHQLRLFLGPAEDPAPVLLVPQDSK